MSDNESGSDESDIDLPMGPEDIDFYQVYSDEVKDSNDIEVYKKFITDMYLASPRNYIDIAINKIIPLAMYRFNGLDQFLLKRIGDLRGDFSKHNDLILRAIRDTRFPNLKAMFDISCKLMKHRSCYNDRNDTCDEEIPTGEARDENDLSQYALALKMYEEYSVISMQQYCQYYSSVVFAVYNEEIYHHIFYYWIENEDYRIRYHALVSYVSEQANDIMMEDLNCIWVIGKFAQFIHYYDGDNTKEPNDIEQVIEILGLLINNGLDVYAVIEGKNGGYDDVLDESLYDVLQRCNNTRLRNLVKDFQPP